MTDDLENVDFSRDSLYIGLVLDFILLQYLDGYLLSGDKVGS